MIATYTSATALASTPTLFTFTVPIIGDTLDEADETFRITLSDAVNARLAGTAGTVSITDNDAAPVITINSASLVEGDAGTTDMVFTVTLSAASGQEVSVKFDALDGTGNTGATSGGGFADFVKTTGTLTFTPDETQKEIRVKINGDTFREADEMFTLQLTNQVNGTFIQNSGTGTGTILNGGDTTLGIAIVDGFKVEGDSGTQDMLFTVELSQANPTTATTFNVIPTNGTAVRGSDFALVTINNNVATVVDKLSGTIAVNSKTTTVTVQVNGDGVFEPTENFFLNLRNVANSAEPAIEIAGGAARGTIFNDDLRRVDNQTIQFIDVDGDLATVHVSHGALLVTDLGFGAANDIGGRQLQQINFIGDTRFQDADLTVTARHQPGFKGSSTGVKGDGHVNVGAILAASVRGDILQFVNGIDLGTVNIDGDLGKIIVGDDVVTPAIDTLVVRSMGRFGTRTQGGTSGQDTTSFVLGPIGNLLVGGNFAGELRVIGSQFGSIKYLQIDGALLGGTVDNSGSISFTGKIGSGFVGQITGGGGANSGVINGSASRSFIGDLRVGLVSGGTADASGVIFATTIRSLTIKGLVGGDVSGDNPATAFGSGIVRGDAIQKLIVKRNVVGGDRNNSGRIIANNSVGLVRVEGEVRGGSGSGSGAILAGGASQISVFGSILGGSGSTSGRIAAVNRIDNLLTGGLIGGSGADSGKIDGSSIQNLSVFGIIQGGSGDGSGGVDLSGKLGRGTIGGNIVGGDSRVGASLLKSGYVIAHRIQSLDVQGDVRSGANLGTGLALSGTVRAETSIGMLHIHGSVVGSEDIAAIIAAPGTAKRPAIRSLKIDGEARFAEVLAGYSVDGTIANARGTATNSDSQIGRVTIGGDVRSLSIIAGVDAGTDGRFGTSDDLPIGGTGTINAAGTVSKIAQIVIGGTVRGNTRSSGIEAQFVDVLKVNGVAFPLTGGQGNDLAPGAELATGSKIRVFEVPVV